MRLLIPIVFASIALFVAGCSDAAVRNTRILFRVRSVSLTGHVSSEIGPVVGATVTATNTRSGLTTSTTTGATGAYFMDGLRSGEYVICVEARDYKRKCRSEDGFFESLVAGSDGYGVLVDRDRKVDLKIATRVSQRR